MRNLILSTALIAVPALGFGLIEMKLSTPAAATTEASVASLGALSAYAAIVSDVQAIAAKGDLVAAEKRATDLEALWDQNAAALQAKDGAAWGVIDSACDTLFHALRASSPDAAAVDQAATGLIAALQGTAQVTGGGVQYVKGIAVTDVNGHNLPCETLTKALAAALATKTTPDAVALRAKSLERCNADDDAHSNAFAAEALALLQG